MTAKRTEIIFRRPKAGYEECDPEQWEDSAISQAYDQAVELTNDNKTKSLTNGCSLTHCAEPEDPHCAQRNGPAGEVVWARPKISKQVAGNATKKVSKKPNVTDTFNVGKKETRAKGDWQVGDECVAIYYEDELYYKCNILSINEKDGNCLVEYVGYGNKETVQLSDLHKQEEWDGEHFTQQEKITSCSRTSSCSTSTVSDTYSSTEGVSSDTYEQSAKDARKKFAKYGQGCKQSDHHQNRFAAHGQNPPFNPTFLVPPPLFMGPISSSGPAMTPEFYNGSRGRAGKDLSDDALSSMLMSWYMAGYHTGYYQGVNSKGPRKQKR